jgi:hypothetical protein
MILCLPILFAAGMSLLDSLDGAFMNAAYGWAFVRPVRKLFYNITITGLSVAVALVIGTIELGGLSALRLNLSGAFWEWFENININFLGFVIVGMFVVTWAVALLVWRIGKIEERWSLPQVDNPVISTASPSVRSSVVELDCVAPPRRAREDARGAGRPDRGGVSAS